LFATAGRPDPEPPPPADGPFVAIAVGKTKEGESLPAKPVVGIRQLHFMVPEKHQTYPTWRNRYRCKCNVSIAPNVHRIATLQLVGYFAEGVQNTYLSMTTAGVWDAMLTVAFAEHSHLFRYVMRQLRGTASRIARAVMCVWLFDARSLRGDDLSGSAAQSSTRPTNPANTRHVTGI